MKILLVDDERLLLDSLEASLDWESHGITWVGKATSGDTALKLCEEQLPDLVITDIKMSPMDGLTLTQKLRELYPNIKVIIMSSYKDFEYARHAIELGVSSYLLKLNTVKEELLYAIERVRNEIDRNIPSLSQNENVSILNIFKGIDLNDSMIAPLADEKYIMFAIHISPETEKRLFEPTEIRPLVASLNQRGLTALDSPNCYLFYPLKDEQVKSIRNIMIRLKSQLSITFGNVSIVASNVVNKYQAVLAYNQSNQLLRKCFFEGKNSVLVWSENDTIETTPLYTPAPYQDFIFDATSGNYVLLKEKLLTLYDDIETLQCIGKRNLLNMVEHLMMLIYKTLRTDIDNTDILETIQDIGNILYLEDLKHVTDWLMHHISERSNYSHMSPMIKRCIDYIYAHYSDLLSLGVIAEHMNISATYLSKAFNTETGENITDFIHRCKMEYAKKMLILDEKLEIKKIASALSFDSASYFTYLFRNYTGYSPTGYRKQAHENVLETPRKDQ